LTQKTQTNKQTRQSYGTQNHYLLKQANLQNKILPAEPGLHGSKTDAAVKFILTCII